MKIFRLKTLIYIIFLLKTDCGYSLEPPRDAVLTSTHNLCFLAKIRKIMYRVYPFKPQFYYIKVGFKGVGLYRRVCVMFVMYLAGVSNSYWLTVLETLVLVAPPGWQHSSIEIDHEIYIFYGYSVPSADSRRAVVLSVCGESICTILVNRLEDYACPGKCGWLTSCGRHDPIEFTGQ